MLGDDVGLRLTQQGLGRGAQRIELGGTLERSDCSRVCMLRKGGLPSLDVTLDLSSPGGLLTKLAETLDRNREQCDAERDPPDEAGRRSERTNTVSGHLLRLTWCGTYILLGFCSTFAGEDGQCFASV